MTALEPEMDGEGLLLLVPEDEEETDGIVIDLRTRDQPGLRVEPQREVPFVDLRGEYQRSKSAIDAAMAAVLEKGDFVLGEAVARFESEFAAFCEAGFGIGVDSGFSALELILRGMGIGPGDEVITAANTFIATVNAIDAVGARPVLVDVDPITYDLDPEQVEAAITPSTAAVIAVHLYGRPADMGRLAEIAHRHGLALIEDACQAHGARHQGVRAGSLGDAAAFSFYPSKNLGGFGDGGMVVTSDAGLARRIRLLRNLGSEVKYHHTVKGFNRRLDTLQAAVLRVKLIRLDEANASRRLAAAVYRDLLTAFPVQLPTEFSAIEHVYHLFVVEVDDREALIEHLSRNRVATGIHYPLPVHLQEAHRELGYRRGAFPVTEEGAQRILSLPMYPEMPVEALARVAMAVGKFYQGSI
ncbi:MAG: DegT/DnrJ/EryC1/StrS family aminotransferase [Acidimicrobiia bacterium]